MLVIELLKITHILPKCNGTHNFVDQVDQALNFSLLEALCDELLQFMAVHAVLVKQVSVRLDDDKLILLIILPILSSRCDLLINEFIIDGDLALF